MGSVSAWDWGPACLVGAIMHVATILRVRMTEHRNLARTVRTGEQRFNATDRPVNHQNLFHCSTVFLFAVFLFTVLLFAAFLFAAFMAAVFLLRGAGERWGQSNIGRLPCT